MADSGSNDHPTIESDDLTTALTGWRDVVHSNSEWTSLPSIVPSELPQPLSDVYVELYAVADSDVQRPQGEYVNLPAAVPGTECRLPGQYLLSISGILARTRRRAIIVGDPGAGKSTLVKWIVRAIVDGQLRDFDLPLVVSLGQYAASLNETPKATLVGHFLRIHCAGTVAPGKHQKIADQLRRHSREHGRTVLLLDGWDEVPVDQRANVAKQILEETRDFITVITSRPSGLPRRFVDAAHVELFEIAGLSERSIEELAMRQFRQLGRPESLEPFRQQLAVRADLRTMATNPFLLTMLCRIEVERRHSERLPGTLAGLYERFVEWMRSHYNLERRQKGQAKFVSGHLRALGELSYDCFFTSVDPGYLFRYSELEVFMGEHELAAEPVTASRLVNRVSSVWDEHAFIHASLHEYFAAFGLTQVSEVAATQLFQLAVFSDQRFQVFRFAAGMKGKHSDAMWSRVRHEADMPDRFGLVWLRIARLVEAAGLVDGGRRQLRFDIRERLWEMLRDDCQWYETQSLVVATFAALDSRDLARRLVDAPDSVPSSAVQRIILHVPWRVGVESGLHSLAQHRWPHFVESMNPGGATDADINDCRKTFGARDLDEAQRLDAVNRLGALRDRGAVPPLSQELYTCHSENVRRRIIFALAHIGGRRAVDALVDGFFSPELQEFSESFQVALQIEYIGAIDPEARDAILERLATLPGDDPRLPAALNCLSGLPILDGADVIFGLLQSTAMSPTVRMSSAKVLQSCRNENIARSALNLAREEKDADVRTTLYGIAGRHDFPDAVPWLVEAVLDTGRSEDERSEALNALIRMAQQTDSQNCLVTVQCLLTDLVGIFLNDGCHELEVTIFDGASLFAPILDESLIESVDRFSSNLNETSVRVLRLICTALRLRKLSNAADRLVALILLAQTIDDRGGGRTAFGELAKDAVFALLHLAPERILEFDPDLKSARTVLAQWCHESKSLVFTDRIIDSAGRTIAQCEHHSQQGAVNLPAPGDVRRLVEESLTLDEFLDLCFDHYPDVHRQFTHGQTRPLQTRLLVEYATTRNRLPELVAFVQEKNPQAVLDSVTDSGDGESADSST